MIHRAPLIVLFVVLVAACAGRSPPEDIEDWIEPEEPELVPVDYVDLDRYMGRWYMISNIPYFAEAGNLAPYVEYRRSDEPLWVLDNLYRKKDWDDAEFSEVNGYIEILNPMNNAEGRVTFLRPIWQDFAIVYLDEDYQHSVIAHPSRNYAWTFARTETVDDDVYEEMLESLEENGFDTSRLLKFPRSPSDVGRPGYQ